MNIKSFLLGSVIRINSLHNFKPKSAAIEYVSHVGLISSKRTYSELNYKELKALVSAAKIKGRSKLTTKKAMIAALSSLSSKWITSLVNN